MGEVKSDPRAVKPANTEGIIFGQSDTPLMPYIVENSNRRSNKLNSRTFCSYIFKSPITFSALRDIFGL